MSVETLSHSRGARERQTGGRGMEVPTRAGPAGGAEEGAAESRSGITRGRPRRLGVAGLRSRPLSAAGSNIYKHVSCGSSAGE